MNETRELILNAIGEIARLCPEQRIGQIIFNYVCAATPRNDPFFISDEQLLEIIENTLQSIKSVKER